MKNVLVLVHDDAGQEARLQGALDLTRALNGHLTCLDVSIVPVMVNEYGLFGGSALLMSDEEANEQVNRARVEPRIAAENVPYDWSDVTGDLSEAMCDAAGLVDVFVVNRRLESASFPDMLGATGEIMIKSGKPVVALPEDAHGFDAFGRALVAWDGSRAAEAALRAAVPLLTLAERVTILEIDDHSLAIPAYEAAEYLSRHGIKPTICRKAARRGAASDVMLQEITALAASYLVMGGFGHSRLVEAMLGGVTRRMLQDCPVPLLFAH
jgi:nucleotide-binding universal stress UspA family protein